MTMEHPNVLFFAGTTLSIVCAALFWVRKLNAPSSHQPSSSTPLEVSKIKSEEPRSDEPKKTRHYPGGKVVIYFGSQTGTAEGFGRILVDEGQDRGFATELVDLEDVDAFWNVDTSELRPDHRCIRPQVAIYLMATYGEGEPTDNSTNFIEFLKEKHHDLDHQTFRDVQFTVFGLGNRQYEQYNAMGRLVHKKLGTFGGSCIFDYGEGDDDGSLEEDFESWRELMWTALKTKLMSAVGESTLASDESTSEPHLAFTCDYSCQDEAQDVFPETSIQHSNKHYFPQHHALVPIVVHRQLRQKPELGQSTIHLELDIAKQQQVSYTTADNVAICPENDLDLVTRVAQCQGYVLTSCFRLEPTQEEKGVTKFPFPTPCSVKECLTRYLDLNHAPRRQTLHQLAHFATSISDRTRLCHLSSKAGLRDYQESIVGPHRNLVDVLEMFSSLKVPLDSFIHIVPYLQPRYYTISSSHLVSPSRIHLTVSMIVRQGQDCPQVFRGTCTRYLDHLEIPRDTAPMNKMNKMNKKKKKNTTFHPETGFQGRKTPRSWPQCRIFVRPSSFHLPAKLSIPIIMIGPGTGIAPMRAFCQERQYLKGQSVSPEKVGKAILYFGCREFDRDYIYQDELEKYVEDGTLDELHVAFSRASEKKIYVQHLMEQHSEELWTLIQEQRASIYVCGATAMGHDVHQVLVENIVMGAGQLPRTEAETYVKTLQAHERYVQELWA